MRSYPFSAVPGNEKAKTALLLLCINPNIGSVLLLGKKGSGKTTLLQSIKELIVGELADRSKCVDLPTNVTLDRLLGGVSFESAIRTGEKKVERGLLSLANGGFLFVDHINLLPDPILNNLFLSQENRFLMLEREGIAHREDSCFSFFAAMNGEDPALSGVHLDHIGISVFLDEEEIAEDDGVESNREKADSALRMKVERMKSMMDFERDSHTFQMRYEDDKAALKMRIASAKKLLAHIRMTEEDFAFVADLIEASACPGHRGEIVLCEVAKAIAAYRGRDFVLESDVIEAAEYTLPHRMNHPFKTVDFTNLSAEGRKEGERAEDSGEDVQDFAQEREQCGDSRQSLAETVEERSFRTGGDSDESGGANDFEDDSPGYGKKSSSPNPAPRHSVGEGGSDEDGEGQSISIFSRGTKKEKSLGYGRRRRLVSHLDRGREVGSLIPRNGVQDLSLMATLRAAAMDHRPLHGLNSPEPPGMMGFLKSSKEVEIIESTGLKSLLNSSERENERNFYEPQSRPLLRIKAEHLREKKKETTGGARILFLVDGSASMGARRRMSLVRRVVFSILGDSYVHRDFVAVMIFKGQDARTALPFTRSMERARKCLEALRTGGRTPLILGLREALRFLKLDALKNKNPRYELVLVSDGKNNVLPDHMDFEESLADIRRRLDAEKVGMTVIDTESGFMRLGYAKKISEKLGTSYFSIDKWESWM